MATVGWWRVVVVALVVSTTVRGESRRVLPPRMSTQEPEMRLKEGQTGVVLECSLDVGDQPIKYRWLKNQQWVTGTLGYAFRGRRSLNLLLHTVEKQHAGTYVCEASNEAGVHAASIRVMVENGDTIKMQSQDLPHTDEILSDIAASLSDVMAEGECNCDTMFLLHSSLDTPPETVAAQANLLHTIGSTLISETNRVGLMVYSNHGTQRLAFGNGVNHCALRDAFKDLSHLRFATSLAPVLREAFKKFKKSKSDCKVLFLPIFGSAGKDGADLIESAKLKKLGVKTFILEVTTEPVEKAAEMAAMRGDGRPYHWRIPLHIWRTIVIYMRYMTEEIQGCAAEVRDIPGKCVGPGGNCTHDAMCHGAGYGCFGGQCQPLQCNVNSQTAGCCTTPGQYWCGDVTRHCTDMSSICDGRVQCMNGADEDRCWSNPCPDDKVTRCQSSTLCLDLMDLCDGEPSCPGGEDEDPRFCRSFPCPINRPFRCRSGKCIEKENLCDGTFKDCEEGEDEALDFCNRIHTCPESRPFKCDYGICIQESMLCDGPYNCLDATDELLCSQKNCPAERPFKCLDGLCISMNKVCNGILDGCADGSDENNCTAIPCPVTRSFKCQDNGVCIDDWLKCNGDNDCDDGSDEVGCPTTPTRIIPPEVSPTPQCSRNQYQCNNGKCIPLKKVCDGRRNCLEGEDEEDCLTQPCPTDRQFRCGDGTCVVTDAQCNGVEDCKDGTDEVNCGDEEEGTDYDNESYPGPDDYDYTGTELEPDEGYQLPPVSTSPAPPVVVAPTEPMDTHIEAPDVEGAHGGDVTILEYTDEDYSRPHEVHSNAQPEGDDVVSDYDDVNSVLVEPEEPTLPEETLDMRPPAASSDKGTSSARGLLPCAILTLALSLGCCGLM